MKKMPALLTKMCCGKKFLLIKNGQDAMGCKLPNSNMGRLVL
jgi:hypothetical protein